MPTRRQALLGLAAAGITPTMAGCRGTAGEAPTGVRRIDGSVTSRHVPGSSSYAVATPEKDAPTGLVIALHGYGSNGPHMMELLGLADHVKRTGLAIAAISGGNYYWHARRAVTTGENQHPALDPGAMVVDDFIPAARKLTGIPESMPVSFLGFSMGGYGSLLLASQLGPEKVLGIVPTSAALWTDPGMSAAGAFDDREDFLAHDVFTRTEVLSRIPMRLDCGTSDSFIDANRAFAAKVPQAVTNFDAGGHTGDYWHAHAGRQLDWLASLARQ